MIWWLFASIYGLVRILGLARSKELQLPDERFVALWSLVFITTSMFGAIALLGALWCVPVALAGIVLLAPWRVIRYVCIPLGWVRPAYYLGSIAGWTWNHDLRGGALVAGAWALARRAPGDHNGLIDWLERRRDQSSALLASHVLATGLIAATRGDLAGARALLESVDEIGPRTTPRTIHALAREWLAAEAADRGDWTRVATLAAGERGRTRITRLLGAIAANLRDTRHDAARAPRSAATAAATARATSASGAGRTASWRLWLLWLLSSHRRDTWPLVRRAARMPATEHSDAAIPPSHQLVTHHAGAAHREALAAHITVLRGLRGVHPADALRGLACMWDRALDAPLAQLAPDVADVAVDLRAELSDQVVDDLAELALAHDLPIASWSHQSPILRQVERQLRNQLISEVEIAFDALDDRLAEKRPLKPIDEWREWLSLRRLYHRTSTIGGIELRRLAFPRVHLVACRLAVSLWNEREQHLIANCMFRWLLDEALLVGDAEAIELQRRNWEERY